jgi:hypothetical protein
MRLLIVPLLVAVCAACRPTPQPGESANLARAKALVDQTAQDFEQLIRQGDGLEGDPQRSRALGERLRRAIEGRRAEGEALAKALTDDEKTRLQAYGKQRLAPLVQQLETKLNTLPRQPAPTAPEPTDVSAAAAPAGAATATVRP